VIDGDNLAGGRGRRAIDDNNLVISRRSPLVCPDDAASTTQQGQAKRQRDYWEPATSSRGPCDVNGQHRSASWASGRRNLRGWQAALCGWTQGGI